MSWLCEAAGVQVFENSVGRFGLWQSEVDKERLDGLRGETCHCRTYTDNLR
jgi:hypothetical protein